jgi:hypothetical protein
MQDVDDLQTHVQKTYPVRRIWSTPAFCPGSGSLDDLLGKPVAVQVIVIMQLD